MPFAHVACNLNYLTETEGLFKVTGSYVNCKSGNISKTVQHRDVFLLQITDRKCCMAYRIVTIPMTFSDLQGHAPIARL